MEALKVRDGKSGRPESPGRRKAAASPAPETRNKPQSPNPSVLAKIRLVPSDDQSVIACSFFTFQESKKADWREECNKSDRNRSRGCWKEHIDGSFVVHIRL